MKVYICADCGQDLDVKYSGIPDNRKARIVSSHECTGEKDEFVKKLNDLPPAKAEVEEPVGESIAAIGVPEAVEPGDRRDAEHVKSTAPPGLGQTIGIPEAPNLPEEDEDGRRDPTSFPTSQEDSEE